MHKRRSIYNFLRGVLTLGIILAAAGRVDQVRGAVTVPAFCTNPFKLMPLGDSLTQGKYSGSDTSDPSGAGDDIGYRKNLRNLLTSSGYAVDFVGTLKNGDDPPGSFPDEDHEGHQGETDGYIAQNIYNYPGGGNFLAANPPDVILLHIGTNTPRNKNNVTQILNEIDDYEVDQGKTVIVIVARIIDKGPYDGTITSYNNAVQAMVEARSDYGSELFMVDMEDGAGIDYSPYPAGDMMADKIHLLDSGYTKMANLWKREIDKICGNTPQLVNPGLQSTEEGESVNLLLQTVAADGYTITSFAEDGLPPGLSINTSTGRISGTIPSGARSSSPYNVVVTISDGVGELDQVSFKWTVYQMLDYYLPIALRPKK